MRVKRFAPAVWQLVPRGLHGLGDSGPICLDQNQNAVDCQDPNCTYGDCGAVSTNVPTGSICLDQNENTIACAAPDCTFGDCISPPLKTAGGASQVPRPSPTVPAPQNYPTPRYPQQPVLTPQTLMSYMPLLLFGVFAATLLSSSSGGRRR